MDNKIKQQSGSMTQYLIKIILLVSGLIVFPAQAAETLYYFHNDHLGTPQAMTDESQVVVWQADYKPFGETLITTAVIESNLRFPGQYYDAESGLYYNYFRDYDSSIGRYVESDPIGLSGGINTYGYVLGDPVNTIDPEGKVGWDPAAAIAFPLIGGFVGGIGNACAADGNFADAFVSGFATGAAGGAVASMATTVTGKAVGALLGSMIGGLSATGSAISSGN